MNNEQEKLNNLIGNLLDSAAEKYSEETGASDTEAKMAAMAGMIKELQSFFGVQMPELDQAIDVLDQGRLDAQIRNARPRQEPG